MQQHPIIFDGDPGKYTLWRSWIQAQIFLNLDEEGNKVVEAKKNDVITTIVRSLGDVAYKFVSEKAICSEGKPVGATGAHGQAVWWSNGNYEYSDRVGESTSQFSRRC